MTPGVEKRKKFCRSWSSQAPSTPQQSLGENRKKRGDYGFSTENVLHAIVMLGILLATDLPELKNSASPPS